MREHDWQPRVSYAPAEPGHSLFSFGWCPISIRLRSPVVGTILNLINQGDAILGATSLNWIKIILTYLVPYAVNTYGAVSYRMSRRP